MGVLLQLDRSLTGTSSSRPFTLPEDQTIRVINRDVIPSDWREGETSPNSLSEMVISTIEQLYTLEDLPRVNGFLRKYGSLGIFLLDSYWEILRIFGAPTVVVLRVVSDPEVENWDELMAFIRTDLPPSEALDRLDHLDQEWFLGQNKEIRSVFNFNLEFR